MTTPKRRKKAQRFPKNRNALSPAVAMSHPFPHSITVSMGRMITKSILLVAVLFLVAVPLHADDGKGKKGEAGALEKAKDKVLDSLNWEENVERAKKQIQKTKKTWLKRTRKPA
ncbi:exported hypothetical protein [Nitrospina gracilis 3/211]|uniref:Uncharacterized protein n=2 Tax=Nitrospina TaxID=35800 RepID=M1ZEF2_NITG3|nr:exported hypothetical protein [Nitrospina gracilis 3/211]